MSHYKSIQELSCEVAESYCPSGKVDTRWHTSGIIDFQAPFNRFTVGCNLPLITEGADEQVRRGRSQHIDRNAAAVLLDWNLRRLSQGRAVIDLRLGELLVQLRKRQPQKLGFIRMSDYAREEMGIPWRSASLLISNWTALEKLPLLKKAHREGKISKSKLRFLLRVAEADNEETWIEKASKVSVRALEEFVRAVDAGPRACISYGPCACISYGPCACISQTGPGGKSVPFAPGSGSGENYGPDGKCLPAADNSESGEGSEAGGKCLPVDGSSMSVTVEDRAGYLMTLRTTPEKAAIWDFALEHFRGREGGNFSTEVFIETLLAEFCSAIPLPAGNSHSNAAGTAAFSPRAADASSPNAAVARAHSNPFNSLTSASVPIDTPLPGGGHWHRISGDEDGEFISGDGREADEEREQWQALRRDLEDVTKIWEFLSWTPVTVETPPEWDDALDDIRAIADMIRKIVAMRQLVGFYMGRLLRTVENLHLYADMQFASLNHYVVERLGVSMRTARNLIKLVRSFLSLPVLEKAFKEGVLTQQRALLLLKVAKEKTEKEWLRYGTEVPVLELEREEKRLSRLIEANPNLLDAHRVLPGFVPPEKPGPGSETEVMKAEDDSSYAIEKISTTPVQMFATDKKSDAAGSGAFGLSVQMCATSALPPAAGRYDDDDGPWEVVLRKETVDLNDPSEIESWKMIMSGNLDCEEPLHSHADSGTEPEHDPGQAEIILPERICHDETDSTGKMDYAELPAGTSDSEAAGTVRKMSATEAVSGSITKELTGPPASSSALNTAHSPDEGSAAIRFFIPDSLIPLWNYAFIRYLELAAGSEAAQESPSSADTAGGNASSSHTGMEIQPPPSAHAAHCKDINSLLERFLFSLIYHYLENEHQGLKKMKRRLRHKVIERDGFRCLIPGCSSRADLDDHHIRFRSQGGGDDLPNNGSVCHGHHQQCIHDNRYINIKGLAPDNLTVAMGVEPGRPPFALFINGRRVKTGQ